MPETRCFSNRCFWEKVLAFLAGGLLVFAWASFAGVMQGPWCAVPTVYDFCVKDWEVFTNWNVSERMQKWNEVYFESGMNEYGRKMFELGEVQGFERGFEAGETFVYGSRFRFLREGDVNAVH